MNSETHGLDRTVVSVALSRPDGMGAPFVDIAAGLVGVWISGVVLNTESAAKDHVLGADIILSP